MTIQLQAKRAVAPHIGADETVLWAGQPDRDVILHKDDRFLIPIGLLWGGMATTAGAGIFDAGPFAGISESPFWAICSILLLAHGQYCIWGRFAHAKSLKQRTYYAVTERRVIAVQRTWRGTKMAQVFLNSLPDLIVEPGSDGAGTIRFREKWQWPRTSRDELLPSWSDLRLGSVPVLSDIARVQSVHRLISELRTQMMLRSMS